MAAIEVALTVGEAHVYLTHASPLVQAEWHYPVIPLPEV